MPPSTHRALVLENTSIPPSVQTRPTPDATPGSAVAQILVSGVLSYSREIYNGTRAYPFPTPIVPGMSAIGRITALGPDATALQLGQLVFIDCVVRARDNPDTAFLLAIHDSSTPGSQKLARETWRDGTYAEYARVPLENCVRLDEARLCGELGYSVQDLMYMDYLMVPYGGLRDIRLEPGETVVVSPATAGYGGAAVLVAIAMGARVVAMGRNENELARLKKLALEGVSGAGVETVKMTGDEFVDAESLKAFGVIDAAIDLSPPQAEGSSHIRSIVRSLRKNGRISLMGFNGNPMVHWAVVAKNISFRGKLMYEREDMVQFVKMLERGLFPQGKNFVDTKGFRLEDWKTCFDTAAEHTGISRHVVFVPN